MAKEPPPIKRPRKKPLKLAEQVQARNFNFPFRARSKQEVRSFRHAIEREGFKAVVRGFEVWKQPKGK